MLNLYGVENGWVGETATHVLVIATGESHAIDLARSKFRFAAEKHDSDPLFRRSEDYGEGYWNELRADLLLEDVNRTWASEVQQ